MEGDTWEEGRRLEGEKVTVVEIFGGGVGGFGSEDGDGDGDDGIEDEDDEGALDLGAKKREITCCFCFPIAWWCLHEGHRGASQQSALNPRPKTLSYQSLKDSSIDSNILRNYGSFPE